MKKAQLDICIAILLDPTNQEIPSILSRIFTNQNLSDVLSSKEMEAAKEYLSSVNIKDALRFYFCLYGYLLHKCTRIYSLCFESLNASLPKANCLLEKSVKREKYRHLFTDSLKYEEEEYNNLKLIEEKKKVGNLMKFFVALNVTNYIMFFLQSLKNCSKKRS